jgi:pyroglutamyl-peptidase
MILATAFNAFGTAPTNASEVLLRGLGDDPRVVPVVLRTEYEAARGEMVRLIRELRPQAVVAFGVAAGGSAIRLERVARNWDGAPAPDNAGDVRPGEEIVTGAPETYPATLPYRQLSAELTARQIPYTFTDDAGGYVCNHVFYCARHEIEESGLVIPCGLIHVPPITGQQEFTTLLKAMRVCIEVLSCGGVEPQFDLFHHQEEAAGSAPVLRFRERWRCASADQG